MLGIRDQATRPSKLLPALGLGLLLASTPVGTPRAQETSAADATASDAAASDESATTSSDPHAPHHTDQIRIDGNDEISDGEIRDHMLTQAPPWFRFWTTFPFFEDEVREDMKRIVALYRQRGYYETTADYHVVYSDEGPGVTVHVEIDEGEPVELATLELSLPGGTAPQSHPLIDARPWRKLVRGLALREGRTFRLADYQASREAVLTWVAEHGFAKAQLEGTAEVDLPSHRAHVEWTLVLGPRIRLGEIDIEGLEDVDRFIVEREIRIEPGEWYSLRALAKTRRRIQNLALFRWTIVEALEPEAQPSTAVGDDTPGGAPEDSDAEESPASPTPTPKNEPDPEAEPSADEASEEQVWPVSVRVAERPPRRIRLGGGWGTDTSFRGELAWQHRNFFGGARHMDVGVRYSGLGGSFRPSFTEPYLFGTRTRFLFSPAAVYEIQDAYSARRLLIDAQLDRKLIEHMRIRVGYRFDRDDVYSVLDNPGEDVLPEGISIITGPNIGLSRSTVDNRLNATSGTLVEIDAASSVSALGSDEDFLRYTLDARGYFALLKTVVALRGVLGTIQNLGDTDAEDIPLVERFYSGGSNSMRGFGYRDLSPKDANGDPIGGSSLIEGNLEWRIPIWGPVGIVGFLDAAQVDPEPWKFRVDDLLYAAGTGLRYMTPAGPLRVDFGWRLNPREDRGKFRVSASLGHTF